ncbi:hypothetical protein [Butyrivibrio sp. LB2008]|uniref:hypothetical protein n=1 Tax=Butyrivibrio sp. LB2008 TaxID=1408305 RepID=UPI000479744F|nr:hypothetical protein [Butyrivibrio sp. LB2008]
MLKIDLNKANKEEVLDCFFSELSKMYLHAMGVLEGRESTYESEDYALIEKGKLILKEHMKVKHRSNTISIDTSSTDDICFCIAGQLLNQDSYSDCYGHDEQSSIKYALQTVLEKNPEIVIKGDFEVQGSSYFYTETIETKGKLVFVSRDDDDDIGEREAEDKRKIYDEKAFLADVTNKYSYSRFMETFRVNKQFSEKMYKEFLLSNFLYKTTTFYREGYSYEDFKMYIFLCVFEDESVGIGEDDYKRLFGEFIVSIGDIKQYEKCT